MIPTITPNRPKALPKIYTTKILTNESGFCASAIAHPLPETPTQILSLWKILPTEQVGEAYRDSGPEKCVAAVHDDVWVEGLISFVLIDLALKDNCHNNTVDSHGLTEDDTGLLKKYLTRFLDLILGALTAAPRILAPAMKIPLSKARSTKRRPRRKLRGQVRCRRRPRSRAKCYRRGLPSFDTTFL